MKLSGNLDIKFGFKNAATMLERLADIVSAKKISYRPTIIHMAKVPDNFDKFTTTVPPGPHDGLCRKAHVNNIYYLCTDISQDGVSGATFSINPQKVTLKGNKSQYAASLICPTGQYFSE